MRVFQINVVRGASTGSIAKNIAHGIRAAGGESILAYGRGEAADNEEFYKFTKDSSVAAHAMLSRVTDRAGFYSKRDTLTLIERIKRYSPDIIHLHNIHGYYLNIEVLFNFLKEYKRQVVWTLHDCWPITGHCAYFDMAGCDRWKTGCFSCPNKCEYPKSRFLDNSNKNYKIKKELFSNNDFLTIVSVSNWLDKIVGNSYLADTHRMVIHNGIDTNIFKPKGSLVNTDKKIVLGVASVWDRRKGFSDYITLSKMLGDDYRVVLVGLTKHQIRELPESVEGVERTDGAEKLAAIYSSADVFVNLTYEDNLPTVNLEAVACGTPVITYDTGGCRETVYGGTVIPKGNVSAVAEAIMNGEYKKSNVDYMTIDRLAMSEKYIELYNKILVHV